MQNDEIVELAKSLDGDNDYTIIVDFTRTADLHRLFLVRNSDWEIVKECFTSHGSGSGPLKQAEVFSNVPNSLKSSKGRMKTGKTYVGKHGYSRRLIGLEPGINNNVEARAIVLHPSSYVDPEYVRDHGFPGRSWGCITLEPDQAKEIVDLMVEGSTVYVHTNETE